MEKLLREAFRLKSEIDRKTKRLREINQEVANQAFFKEGKKIGHVLAGGIQAKVSLRENVKWDQDKLFQISNHFDHFHDAFKIEYKPKSAKALDIAMVNEDFALAVDWARTISPGSPTVKYEVIEDDEKAA